jgi:hypothetical protein
MENSCLKKYKPSSKKWILASRCAGLRRNSALIPANAGLFHYAGNNPVRYIDPTGMYEQDHEDKVYSFDIRNKSDFDDVASIMMDKQREGYVARGFDSNTGNYIEFNSYSGMLKFSEATRDPFSLNEVIDCANFIASGLSNILTVGSVANEVYKSEIVNGAISFDGFLTKPGYFSFFASTATGLADFFENPSVLKGIDIGTDIGISAIGTFGGTRGLYVSVGLIGIKKCIKGYAFASEQLGKFKIYEERKLVNSISQFYFGRNIK